MFTILYSWIQVKVKTKIYPGLNAFLYFQTFPATENKCPCGIERTGLVIHIIFICSLHSIYQKPKILHSFSIFNVAEIENTNMLNFFLYMMKQWVHEPSKCIMYMYHEGAMQGQLTCIHEIPGITRWIYLSTCQYNLGAILGYQIWFEGCFISKNNQLKNERGRRE